MRRRHYSVVVAYWHGRSREILPACSGLLGAPELVVSGYNITSSAELLVEAGSDGSSIVTYSSDPPLLQHSSQVPKATMKFEGYAGLFTRT